MKIISLQSLFHAAILVIVFAATGRAEEKSAEKRVQFLFRSKSFRLK